jgi:outer membrane receptor protein involved in Fe transport
VASYTTIDATLLYKLGKLDLAKGFADNITFSIAVQNLTDKQPPFALITNDQEFDSQQASALGRLITFGVRKSF